LLFQKISSSARIYSKSLVCSKCTIIRPAVTYLAETWTLTSKIEKYVNDMGEKDIEENIWSNKGKWTVEN
jgi:hypothetical protein